MSLSILLILSVLASVAAFVPITQGRLVHTPLALAMGYEKELGVQPPLGFFDPLGILKDADQAEFDRLRYCEVKHGRVAMLAVLGHIVTTKGDR